MIKVPALFRYTSDKVVLRNYTNQVISQEAQAVRVNLEEKQSPSINDIAEIGGLTRSDRCYASGPLRVREGGKCIEQSDVEVTILKKKCKEALNEPVSETEANEFLKFIKHSEYNIVEQLHMLLAKISLLSLMLNFEAHREAMLKVLKQAYVPHNTSIDKIDRLVGNIMMDNYVSFSDDEIHQTGMEALKLCISPPKSRIAPYRKS